MLFVHVYTIQLFKGKLVFPWIPELHPGTPTGTQRMTVMARGEGALPLNLSDDTAIPLLPLLLSLAYLLVTQRCKFSGNHKPSGNWKKHFRAVIPRPRAAILLKALTALHWNWDGPTKVYMKITVKSVKAFQSEICPLYSTDLDSESTVGLVLNPALWTLETKTKKASSGGGNRHVHTFTLSEYKLGWSKISWSPLCSRLGRKGWDRRMKLLD